MKLTRCIRCNRLLKDPISIKRGYGPTCFTLSINEETKAEDRIKQLETELELLKRKVESIQALPSNLFTNQSTNRITAQKNLPPIPHLHINNNINSSDIYILAGGWDIGELKDNDLFLKMQSLANACG